MKVLYVIDSFQIGGAEKSLLDITSNLSGAEVVVCGVYKRDDLLQEFIKRGINTYHLNINGKYNWRKAFKVLSKVVDREKPDIIHATLFRSCILSRFIGKKYKLPVINSIVSDSYGEERLSSMHPVRRVKHYYTFLLDKVTSGKVDLFISNSNAVKRSYSSRLGISESKVVTIYRGREAGKYIKSVNSEKVRKDVSPQSNLEGHFVFVCVGRLVESKGHLLLLQAFKQLSLKYPNTSLLIVGEGPFRRAIEEYISSNDLEANTILLGNRNDIPALLNISDAFVTSTYYEGLSGAIIEAMFSNLPIIASDIEPNLELVGDDRGWTFKKGDWSELHDKMELLLHNNGDSKLKVENAFKFANLHLEISAVTKKYLDTYRNLIDENTVSRY